MAKGSLLRFLLNSISYEDVELVMSAVRVASALWYCDGRTLGKALESWRIIRHATKHTFIYQISHSEFATDFHIILSRKRSGDTKEELLQSHRRLNQTPHSNWYFVLIWRTRRLLWNRLMRVFYLV